MSIIIQTKIPSILKKIAEGKSAEFQMRQENPNNKVSSISELQRSTRDFKAALKNSSSGTSKASIALIAEIKKASPSEGTIHSGDSQNSSKSKENFIAKQAKIYEQAGVSAISVLCDEAHFSGHPLDMLAASKATKKTPILCKDFILQEAQILEARAHGADAILLIAALLTSEKMEQFIQLARSLNMDALCEVHNKEELEKVLQTSAEIIGINHRDLNDFSINTTLSSELIPLIPEGKIIVAESGIQMRKDVQKLHERTSAMLIGTAIMKSSDIHLKIKSLISNRPLIKICGVQSAEEALFCEGLGVELIGLNFAPKSKRKLTLNQAEEIMDALKFKSSSVPSANSTKRSPLKTVGVFQDLPIEEVNTITQTLKLDYIQLVGYSDQDIEKVNTPLFLTVQTLDSKSNNGIGEQKNCTNPAALILDGSNPGSGEARTQEIPQSRGFQHVRSETKCVSHLGAERLHTPPFFLAGGLNPENAPKDVFGIDLASGVETEGKRDLQKIQQLVENLTKLSPDGKPQMKLKKILLHNRSGHFGPYGGAYVPELLAPLMDELQEEFFKAIEDPNFLAELKDLQVNYAGRRTPLIYCKNLTEKLGGAQIYYKNEGLLHTGAHKINHCLGQALIAKRLGKTRLVAETGAGQHGLATATIAAKFGMKCTIYMGAKDYARQRPNVFFMERLGAEVIPVHTGGKILKDAVNAAIGDLIANPTDTHFLLGTVCGPHPYPVMNTFFQKVIGEEVREQALDQIGRLPDTLIACCGGGSNAIGLFYDFLDEPNIELRIVEAGGKGIKSEGKNFTHAARFQGGKPGIIEGFKSIFLQDEDGQVGKTQSISAGLDYAGVGPQHAYLAGIDRIKTSYATDDKVLEAYEILAKTEGIIAAMESCHAVAEAIKLAPTLAKDHIIVVNGSGRGDKDLFITTQHFDKTNFNQFLRNFT
jgi:tryptophan synthase beta chain